jgi:iron complex transport system substrate-binding protein
VVLVFAVFCAGIGLVPPRVVAKQSSVPFMDMSGDSVDIARPPRSVAVLAPVLSPFAAVAGGLNSVQAVSNFVQLTENNGAFRLVFPQLAHLPLLSRSGAAPDPELVLRFEPDVVLAWGSQSGALRAAGYPGLVALEGGGKDINGAQLWDLLGKLLNDEPRATLLWQDAEAQRRNLRSKLPRRDAIKVLVMSPYDSTSTWIGRRGYFLNPLLLSLGAASETSDLGPGGFVGPEQVLRYDPDIILVPSFVDTDDLSDIYGNPVWRALGAVRGKRVYLMPHTSEFNVPVEETPLLFWLAEILYPTLPHMTREAYRSVYADVYGRNLSEADIDSILHLKKNAGAFGYERFRAASSN